jgi:CMP-N-acetylneuraminic acid synthetase
MVIKRIAIILARGGSKRLPRKNVLPLGGQPMLAWTVSAAIEANSFDRVLVSTDDEEIAALARGLGAEVPFLRDTAADDHATSSEATWVALLQAEAYWGQTYEVVAQLMANCPFRSANDIREAIQVFEAGSAPAQISAFRFGWMNPWWAARLQIDGQPEWLFPEAKGARSQDQAPLYCPSGALWLARRTAFLDRADFYLQGHTLHPISWLAGMDIDDEDDLAMAEACLALRISVGEPA